VLPLWELLHRKPGEDEHHRAAIVDDHGVVTYPELAEQCASYRAALARQGIGPGDHVALLARPTRETVTALLAIMLNRSVAVPINLRWPSNRVIGAMHGIECANALASPEFHQTLDRFSGKVLDFSELDAPPEPPPTTEADETGPAVIIFTSGSTGVPKAAALSFENLFNNAVASNQIIRMTANDRWLLSLPIFHVAGLGVIMRCLAAATAIAIPPQSAALADSIRKLDVTHASFVPTQVMRLLETPAGRDALAHLKAILLGGGPIPATLVRECARLELPIHATYGMTETASQAATSHPEATTHDRFTAGKPLVPGSIGIAEDGEILVRGPTLFLGYLENGNLQRPVDQDGWFHTGDLGRFADHGNLIVIGRKDNMFISGGENIHPETIERELCRLVGIEQAVVVPKNDPDFGQRPVAFVHTREDASMRPEEILEELRPLLPSYAMPVAILPWPDQIEEGMKINRQEFIRLANK